MTKNSKTTRDVYIIGAARTPIGGFLGTLSSFSAVSLGKIVIEEALKRAKIPRTEVDSVIMGNVLTSGLGQAPARQASLGAGLPEAVGCLTINKVCGSGLKAVMIGTQAIKAGDAETIVAGGMESMSNAPYIVERARTGLRMGHGQVLDCMIKDGLWDAYNNCHMGNCAEVCAGESGYTREAQDQFAISSFKKAQEVQKSGGFKEEIVPVPVPQKKGDPILVLNDEGPDKLDEKKVPLLKPSFAEKGTITAANASSISDGAACVVISSQDKVKSKGLAPMARIVSYAESGMKPVYFPYAPIDAMKKALELAGLTKDQIDLWEINEAFSVVTIAGMDKLGIDKSKVNIKGGAVALGHPIGASGARILTTLLYAMKDKNARYGLATLCIGGGEAVALVVERQ